MHIPSRKYSHALYPVANTATLSSSIRNPLPETIRCQYPSRSFYPLWRLLSYICIYVYAQPICEALFSCLTARQSHFTQVSLHASLTARKSYRTLVSVHAASLTARQSHCTQSHCTHVSLTPVSLHPVSLRASLTAPSLTGRQSHCTPVSLHVSLKARQTRALFHCVNFMHSVSPFSSPISPCTASLAPVLFSKAPILRTWNKCSRVLS